VGEKPPGLSGAAFFDLYTDPREEGGKMLPTRLSDCLAYTCPVPVALCAQVVADP
jgi:hypothetical protein